MLSKFWRNITDFFLSSWQELGRVSWPTRQQALNYTVIVIFITALTMVYLGALDAFFAWGYFQLSQYFQVY